MTERIVRRGFGILALALAVLVLVVPCSVRAAEVLAPLAPLGPADLSTDSSADQLSDILQSGILLERAGHWEKAVSHYESALRRLPDNQIIKQRYELARLHYDVSRRYQDRSYLRLLATISFEDSLRLYDDVLLKIEAHYVDQPDWNHLAARGIDGLLAAFEDEKFKQWHLSRTAEAELEAFRQAIRSRFAKVHVRTRTDLRGLAVQTAQEAASQLGLQPAAVIMEFACAAAACLDPYSAFLTPAQLQDLYSQIEGNFVGLGVELRRIDAGLEVVKVLPHSPAAKAGIKAGDRILAVDGRKLAGLSLDEAAALLQGPANSTVELVVQTPGQASRSLQVTRQEVEIPSIEMVQMLDLENGIAYLKLGSFQKTTVRDLDRALWTLYRMGMRSLIIDLRGNPGGLLSAAVEAADRFLEDGIIVSTHGRNVTEDAVYTAHSPGTWQVPLVVLIDEQSASAAEIFAGAIRDQRRGIIVGTTSYGKGSVQGIFQLCVGQTGLRITTSRFYSPNGMAYCNRGVKPDVLVRVTARPSDTLVPVSTEGDPVVAAALELARRNLAHYSAANN